MPSAKEIGRDVHQTLAGIGSLVAGAFLGPAGASGVQMAAGGVDKLIDRVVPDEPKPPPSKAPESETQAPPRAQEPITATPPDATPPATAPPGSVQSTVELLREAGWDPSEVLAALRGPAQGRPVLAMSLMTVESTRGGPEGGAMRKEGSQEVVRMRTREAQEA